MSTLVLEDVHVHYGGIKALRGISLAIEPGEIVTLIGANGAGKTTTLRTISGLLRPAAGHIRFDGTDLTRLGAHEIVALGISHAPEGRIVFANLSVRENLQMGAYRRRDHEGVRRDLDRVFTLFPRLRERYGQNAGTLSGGEQQMLAVGRALMSNPRLLLLDEPSLGLAPILVRDIFQTIREINAQGTTVLLVEQNAHMALRIATRGYVIETGSVILSGPASALAVDERVRKAYLGE